MQDSFERGPYKDNSSLSNLIRLNGLLEIDLETKIQSNKDNSYQLEMATASMDIRSRWTKMKVFFSW